MTKQETDQAIGIVVVIIIIIIASAIAFWPLATEGVIHRVQHGWSATIITFDDGRTLRVMGQPSRSLVVGKYYVVTYNNLGYFYKVEEKIDAP